MSKQRTWFRGAIPRDDAAVADNLDLWRQDEKVSKNGFLVRALARAAGTIRGLIAERDSLAGRVADLEAERPQWWKE
ncbi:MAG: hypothetical protein WBA67_14050 [Jannaschia sp.]